MAEFTCYRQAAAGVIKGSRIVAFVQPRYCPAGRESLYQDLRWL